MEGLNLHVASGSVVTSRKQLHSKCGVLWLCQQGGIASCLYMPACLSSGMLAVTPEGGIGLMSSLQRRKQAGSGKTTQLASEMEPSLCVSGSRASVGHC